MDVVGVVGDVWEFDNDQLYCLVGFTRWVRGDTGEGACVFDCTNENVQCPVGVDQRSGGVGDQFALRGNPVNGWLWVTSCLTPLWREAHWSGAY